MVSGPITHTPDGGYLMGPAPGVRNYWMCAGASIGITQGPGAGKYLAQWMVHGQTEINVREMDPRRFGPWSDLDYTILTSPSTSTTRCTRCECPASTGPPAAP